MQLTTRARLEIASSVAVFASITIMALETFDWSPEVREWLAAADLALGLLFLGEYLLRIATAEDKRAYITSFYGLIDLIANLPLLVHGAASARVIRLLRVLRIVRLLKVQRYNNAMDRFARAIRLIAAELTLFAGTAFIFVFTFAFLIYEFENEAQPEAFSNIFDCIWWAVISLTSVGYGDSYPITDVGRLLTLLMVLTGMGIVAVPTALLASALKFASEDGDD